MHTFQAAFCAVDCSLPFRLYITTDFEVHAAGDPMLKLPPLRCLTLYDRSVLTTLSILWGKATCTRVCKPCCLARLGVPGISHLHCILNNA